MTFTFCYAKLNSDVKAPKFALLVEFLKTVCHKMQKATSLNLFKNSVYSLKLGYDEDFFAPAVLAAVP